MAPRIRKKNPNWPKYVYVVNGRIVYRPYISSKHRQNIETGKGGFLKPPIRLGRVGDPDDKILRAYMAAKQSLEHTAEPDKHTLFWLKEKYTSSTRYTKLTAASQKKYSQLLDILLSTSIKISGVPAKFGDLLICRLTRPIIRQLLDRKLREYIEQGKKGTAQVNRQFSALSSMITYGLQYHEGLGIDSNPCFGIEKFKENIKTRYVTDEDYWLQYNIAHEIVDYLPVVFEHAYLLASRGVEVRNLKFSNITDEGYIVKRRKGSKDNIILWSDRLKLAYQEAMKLHKNRKISSLYLIPSKTGRKLTQNTLQGAMGRLRKEMQKRGFEEVYWTIHDLKRKGISDSENKKIGGHKSQQIMDNYNVKLEFFSPPK